MWSWKVSTSGLFMSQIIPQLLAIEWSYWELLKLLSKFIELPPAKGTFYFFFATLLPVFSCSCTFLPFANWPGTGRSLAWPIFTSLLLRSKFKRLGRVGAGPGRAWKVSSWRLTWQLAGLSPRLIGCQLKGKREMANGKLYNLWHYASRNRNVMASRGRSDVLIVKFQEITNKTYHWWVRKIFRVLCEKFLSKGKVELMPQYII